MGSGTQFTVQEIEKPLGFDGSVHICKKKKLKIRCTLYIEVKSYSSRDVEETETDTYTMMTSIATKWLIG